jgi:hypothetical protein
MVLTDTDVNTIAEAISRKLDDRLTIPANVSQTIKDLVNGNTWEVHIRTGPNSAFGVEMEFTREGFVRIALDIDGWNVYRETLRPSVYNSDGTFALKS